MADGQTGGRIFRSETRLEIRLDIFSPVNY